VKGDSKGVDVRFIHGSLFCGILMRGRLYSQEPSEGDGHELQCSFTQSSTFPELLDRRSHGINNTTDSSA
jgi:hypothetical protein